MQCHKCPHFNSVQDGTYDAVPWSATPCAACRLGEDTFFSAPFDEVAFARGDSISPALSEHTSRATNSTTPTPNRLLPESIISSIIAGLLSLDPVLRDIVAWRYQGLTYREIADRQGTSVQLAEMRHKRAIRDWPALRALFPEKIARQTRRKSNR